MGACEMKKSPKDTAAEFKERARIKEEAYHRDKIEALSEEMHRKCGDCANFGPKAIDFSKYHICLASASTEKWRRLYLNEELSVVKKNFLVAGCKHFKSNEKPSI